MSIDQPRWGGSVNEASHLLTSLTATAIPAPDAVATTSAGRRSADPAPGVSCEGLTTARSVRQATRLACREWRRAAQPEHLRNVRTSMP